jgi:hypothetical protein
MTHLRARALVVGWASFVDGEATAGDVLAMEAVRREVAEAGLACDVALSPVFRPDGLGLEQADPARYTHLLFACGPLHGRQVADLHGRYRHCRRIAVGVSVTDPADPAAAGFHEILPRDDGGNAPRADLAVHPRPRPVPVAGVILVDGQAEYGTRGHHHEVSAGLIRWLGGWDCAVLPLQTRLDRQDWRLCRHPGQLEALIGRVDLVVTMRMHGLVLALKNGVPALAADPVAGGAKVSAQALAWRWPALVRTGPDGALDHGELNHWRDWCLSPAGARAASAAAQSPPASPLGELRRAAGLTAPGTF